MNFSRSRNSSVHGTILFWMIDEIVSAASDIVSNSASIVFLLAGGGPIRPRHIDLPRERPSKTVAVADGLEARMIESALRQSGGVVSHAAAAIGWTRQKLARRMAVVGIRYRASGSTREMTSSHSSTPHELPSRKARHSS